MRGSSRSSRSRRSISRRSKRRSTLCAPVRGCHDQHVRVDRARGSRLRAVTRRSARLVRFARVYGAQVTDTSIGQIVLLVTTILGFAVAAWRENRARRWAHEDRLIATAEIVATAKAEAEATRIRQETAIET